MYHIFSIRRHSYYFFCYTFLCGYYLRAATIGGWCLFVWKTRRHQWRLDKVCTSDTVTLLHDVNSTHSLSVLLSAVETTRTTQTALALAWWLASVIICTRACAAYSSRGYYMWVAFISLRAPDYVATIRGRQLFKGGVYSKKLWYTHMGKSMNEASLINSLSELSITELT